VPNARGKNIIIKMGKGQGIANGRGEGSRGEPPHMANIAAVGREADIRDKSGKRVKFSRGRNSETRVEGKGKGVARDSFGHRDVRLTGVRVEGGEGVHESGAPQPMVMPKGSIGPVTNLNRGEVPEIRKTVKDTKPNSSVGTMNITQIGGGRPTILI